MDTSAIKILSTGGTIEGLEYDTPSARDSQRTIALENYLIKAKVTFTYTLVPVFSKDSRFITARDRELLLENIEKSSELKILITHGTLSMIETAKFLGKLKLAKTIVLVGAFMKGTDPKTDAPFNLGYAFAALQFLTEGVYIAMNGQIFAYDKVIKNTAENIFERPTNL